MIKTMSVETELYLIDTVKLGGQAKLLTRGQSSTLLYELLRVPSPTDSALRSQYENLKLLLKTAADDERYRTLIWTG
jgi:hypothetical protein